MKLLWEDWDPCDMFLPFCFVFVNNGGYIFAYLYIYLHSRSLRCVSIIHTRYLIRNPMTFQIRV